MGSGASSEAKAFISDAKVEDLSAAISDLFPGDQAKFALVMAWSQLEKVVRETEDLEELFFEREGFEEVPAFKKLEEVICKICGVDIMEIYGEVNLPTDLVQEMEDVDAKMKLVNDDIELMQAESLKAAFLASLANVTGSDETKAKLADFVKDEGMAPEAMAKHSELMKLVSAYLHALCDDTNPSSKDDAWTALEKGVKETDELSELYKNESPPSEAVRLEILLCMLSGVNDILMKVGSAFMHKTAMEHLTTPEEGKGETDLTVDVKTQQFVEALKKVKGTDGVEAKLTDFLKDEDMGPASQKRASQLMWYISTWLHALCDGTNPSAKDDAWAVLEKDVQEKKTLQEIMTIRSPSQKVVKLEVLLCQLSGIDGSKFGIDALLNWDKKQVHSGALAELTTSKEETKEIQEAEEKVNKMKLEKFGVRKKAFLGNLIKAKACEETKVKLEDFVKDEDVMPKALVGAKWLEPISSEGGELLSAISAWLHALHKYSGNL